jgi:hypothetical protein
MMDWNIQSRARACQACAKPFVDQTLYYTLLFQQRHRLERMDVCESCWRSQYSQGATDRKGFVSFWQGLFTVPPPPAPEPIQKESAEGLLRQLCEKEMPGLDGVRYILAVMLERKRVLKVKAQVEQEGRRLFLYEHARNGDVFTVQDPGLRLDQLEEVQRQVADLLERGFDAFVAGPAASAPPPPPVAVDPAGAEPEPGAGVQPSPPL